MNKDKYMNTIRIILATLLCQIVFTSCSNSSGRQASIEKNTATETSSVSDSLSVIYFAGGCFWGTEHFFKQVTGVTATEVGFANGRTENPTYKEVIQKKTGFAETVKVIYDPQKVDLKLLLDLYFLTIDPTSVNKQGNDIGDQYRTGIYYTSDKQLPFINARLKTETKKHVRPVAVEVTPLKKYYKAEDYHQDYLENNPGGYCHINPELFKVAKNANKKNDQ
ncbi:peptide-methionine (S)-S-oxide reductase MsrA [Sphingobacterium sp. NPDC055346]